MPKYRIEIREVHVATHEVEAASKEEALRLTDEGETNELSLEYSHTLMNPTVTELE